MSFSNSSDPEKIGEKEGAVIANHVVYAEENVPQRFGNGRFGGQYLSEVYAHVWEAYLIFLIDIGIMRKLFDIGVEARGMY